MIAKINELRKLKHLLLLNNLVLMITHFIFNLQVFIINSTFLYFGVFIINLNRIYKSGIYRGLLKLG